MHLFVSFNCNISIAPQYHSSFWVDWTCCSVCFGTLHAEPNAPYLTHLIRLINELWAPINQACAKLRVEMDFAESNRVKFYLVHDVCLCVGVCENAVLLSVARRRCFPTSVPKLTLTHWTGSLCPVPSLSNTGILGCVSIASLWQESSLQTGRRPNVWASTPCREARASC